MAAYITLINFSEQGIKTIKQTQQRAQDFKTSAQKVGVTVKQVYWTLGGFDGVLVFDAPDDESATAALLGLGARGNVRTQTLRAFEESEIESILAKSL